MALEKTVLVVDDSRVARLMARRVLAEVRPAWQVIEAEDGTVALRLAEEHPFDMALIDVNMPGISGLHLAAALRAHFPARPLCLITANVQESVRVRAAELGVRFIDKPISPTKLETALAAMEAEG